jgi:hypothetical protein
VAGDGRWTTDGRPVTVDHDRFDGRENRLDGQERL